MVASYAATLLCRHILYCVVPALVVQEGGVLFVRDRPATGTTTHLVLAPFLAEARASHVVHSDVVVAPVAKTLPTAVTEE